MPTTKKRGSRLRLQENSNVKKKKPQDVDPQDLTPTEERQILGYLGESTERGFWRLYLTPEFNDYYEIRAEDILDQQCITDGNLECSVLRVPLSAKVLHITSEVVEMRTRYLAGQISDALLESAETPSLVTAHQTKQAVLKRESDDEWFCTWRDSCTEGKVAGRECTYRFGCEIQTKTGFHVTRDLKC